MPKRHMPEGSKRVNDLLDPESQEIRLAVLEKFPMLYSGEAASLAWKAFWKNIKDMKIRNHAELRKTGL